MAIAKFSTSSGTPTAGSTYLSYVPANAFDGNGSTFWSSSTPNVDWLKMDFGSGVQHQVSKYVLQGRIVKTSPKNWVFQGSNNNSSWTTLDTRTGITFTDAETKTYDSFTDSGNIAMFRYYRISVSAVGTGGEYPQIMELELWGEDPEDPEDFGGVSFGSANMMVV